MSDSEPEVKPVKLNKNGKPKKVNVMTPEKLEKLALARAKYQEMLKANRSNTQREKELRKQEKELKLRKLIAREEKVKQLQEKVNGKKTPAPAPDSDSDEDETAKREEALIAREKELEAVVVEEPIVEEVKKVKTKKSKVVVVEESESSDSEEEVVMTKRELKAMIAKKEKREPAAILKPVFDFQADKQRPKPKAIITGVKAKAPVNNSMNDLYNNLFARA